LQLGDVGANPDRGRTAFAQLLDRTAQRRLVEVGEHELRAPGRERTRHGHADAAGAAGDDCYAIAKWVHAWFRPPERGELFKGDRYHAAPSGRNWPPVVAVKELVAAAFRPPWRSD